jgi:hypothetical protein
MTREEFDLRLDRVSKIAGVLLPIVVGVVGAIYTIQKDQSDTAARQQSATQQVTQAQYANFGALLPLMVSNDDRQVSTALSIYKQEAANGQEPQSLTPLIDQIIATKPQLRAQAQAAEQAVLVPQGTPCKEFLNGLFLQVANDPAQLSDGQALAALLKSETGLPPIPGVQRVDSVPQQTQLRYYFSATNDAQASRVIASLKKFGFSNVARQDLSPLYLKNKSCTPPPTFELWIGAADVLDAQGLPHGLTTPPAAP